MKFVYGRNDFRTLKRAEENCYLITNGLGGFSSLTIASSCARGDQTLFMAALTAPNKRYQLIANTIEKLYIDGEEYLLSSQRFTEDDKEWQGFKYLNGFSYEYVPEYVYKVGAVEVIKSVVMKQGVNTLGVKYEIVNYGDSKVSLEVTPLLNFSPKGKMPAKDQKFEFIDNTIKSEGITLKFTTDAEVSSYATKKIEDFYYAYDERDGRNSEGYAFYNHTLTFDGDGEHYVVYSTVDAKENINDLFADEIARQDELIKTAGLKDETAKCLVRGADAYITYRESTKGKSILAGFPFFEDWGRDTMIALGGCTISTKQYDTAKSILRTFMKYCRKGIMPNLFPEGEDAPMYNTVDAALLFINAVYEYYKASGDKEFVEEAMPTINEIIHWYKEGTDFHIKMDTDGLIMAGSDLEQLTWMDVRVNDILPTPRHGKPVEINAYWYNGLMIAEQFSELLGLSEDKKVADYKALAAKVKESFIKEFWNEKENCLKDLASGTKADCQIRCNQIWAASMPYSMLNKEQADGVIKKVFEELYTPVGLRSLSPKDEEFHPVYIGPMEERDMAYHQGTVWGFPLGGYYMAYLKWADDKKKAAKVLYRQLEGITATLREGCIGHISEIYDGLTPTDSKGCFAQAWSVGEILRVYEALEAIENN